MKYDLYFEKTSDDGWDSELLDTWKDEKVVPRVGDNVYLIKIGWKTVTSVGFSTVNKNRRTILISIK